MKYTPTPLEGAFLVTIEPIEDERGFFAENWRQDDLARKGLKEQFVRCNLSFNKKAGTLRGMHYQAHPHEEYKLIRCLRGSIYDVIIDLRPASETYRKWHGVTLSRENRDMLFVPAGFAHGYQTLEDNSEVMYHVTQLYHPEAERGIRHDDAAFSIAWPMPVSSISPKDGRHPKFKD